MRIAFTITDDSGKTFQGQADLTAAPPQRAGRKKTAGAPRSAVAAPINLLSPIRPFMKRQAHGMGGPQKFTLLLAHMVKGNTKQELALATVQKQWGKMTGLLGKWNPAYTTRAKEQEAGIWQSVQGRNCIGHN